MEIFEQTLRDLLISFNLVAGRVYLMRAPQVANSQQTVPYVVFLPVGPIPRVTQHGPLDQIQRDYQLSIFDSSQSRALAIADSYRGRLDTLSGFVENYQIGSCFYMTQTWNWEPENEMFQVIQEYRIMFRSLSSAAHNAVVPTRSKGELKTP